MRHEVDKSLDGSAPLQPSVSPPDASGPTGAHDGAVARAIADTLRSVRVEAERTERLILATSDALAGATTTAGVVHVMLHHGLPSMGATAGVVCQLDATATRIDRVWALGYPEDGLEGFRQVALIEALPPRDVVRHRAPVFVESPAAWLARYLPPAPGMDVAPAAAGLPMMVADRLVGVMVLRFPMPRTFSDRDRRLMMSVAGQCAQALERARLFEAEQAARERAQAEARRVRELQSLTAALAGAVTPEDVATVALERARPMFGAAAGLFNVVTPDGEHLEQLRTSGFTDGVVVPWRRYPLALGTPGAETVRTGQPVFVRSRHEGRARFPVVVPMQEQSGYHAYVVLPMVSAGRVLGILAFNFGEEREFVAAESEQMTAFAGQCALALERAQLYAAERAARAEAEEANLTKMRFLATMSHELRTPLNAIAGYTELIELGVHGTITPAQQEALGRIRRSQHHLLSLINDVLNFARIDAGHVVVHAERLSVATLLAELESLVQPQLAARQLRYRLEPVDERASVQADAEKVQQILLNLLSNAIKFTEPGGEVVVRCVTTERDVEIAVRDTGIGIPVERLESAFEPFVQLDRSLTSNHEGTGLGLAISRDLARLMSGELTARSVVGEGSEFTLRLPRAG